MGNDFTAKDFRTWGANVSAITLVGCTALPERGREVAFKSEIVSIFKQVAIELRNTPAVCRKSYINPAVFDSWRAGIIHKSFSGSLKMVAPRKAEMMVLTFLRRQEKKAL